MTLEPGVEPGRADAADGGEGFSSLIERQDERVDRGQYGVALGRRIHAQFERDADVIVAEEARPAEQLRARRELAQLLGLTVGDLSCLGTVAEEGK